MWPFKKRDKAFSSSTMDYDDFAKACMEALHPVQAKFRSDYDLDRYKNWFYNQSTGLLTLSTDDVEVNFKFIDIGSFSERSKTWKWSWDNDTTQENVKEKIEVVRQFGEKSNYPKLTSGYFESDEFDAWEFAAIAVKLTSAIGVYRPVSDNQLKIFLVVTEFVDSEAAKSIKDKYIQCSKHEYRRVAFVCQHLLKATTKVGFEEAFETCEGMELLDDDDFQAWCDECEAERKKEGEWNEKSQAFADIKVVCEKCYFEMKEFNLGHR